MSSAAARSMSASMGTTSALDRLRMELDNVANKQRTMSSTYTPSRAMSTMSTMSTMPEHGAPPPSPMPLGPTHSSVISPRRVAADTVPVQPERYRDDMSSVLSSMKMVIRRTEQLEADARDEKRERVKLQEELANRGRLEEKVDRLHRSLVEELDNNREVMEMRCANIQDRHRESSDLIGRTTDELEIQMANLQRKMDAVVMEQDQRLSDCDASIASTRGQMEALTYNQVSMLESSIKEELRTTTVKCAELSEQLQVQVVAMEKSHDDFQKRTQRAVDAHNRSHDDRRDRERKLTDKKLSELTKFLSDAKGDNMAQIDHATHELNMKLTRSSDELSAVLVRMQEWSAQQMGALREELVQETAAVSERSRKEGLAMKANFTAVRDSVQQTALMTRGYAEEDNNELEFKIRDFISSTAEDLRCDMDTLKLELTANGDLIEASVAQEATTRENSVARIASEVVLSATECQSNITDLADRVQSQLVAALTTIGGRLDTSVEDLTNKTDKLKKQVEQDVDTNIKAVKNEVTTKLGALQQHVETSVQTSLDQVATRVEVLNTRIKTEIEPLLQGMKGDVDRCTNGVQTNKDRIMLAEGSLRDDLTSSLEQLNATIEDMSQGMDIANVLNALAEEAGSA